MHCYYRAMQGDFVGIADLVSRWGYTRQGVHLLAKRDDFPAPAFTINGGRTKVWRTSDVAAWERDKPELHSEAAKVHKVKGYFLSKQKQDRAPFYSD